jgi:hypothetical protein
LCDVGTAAVARGGRVNRDDFVCHIGTLLVAGRVLKSYSNRATPMNLPHQGIPKQHTKETKG